MKVAICTKYGSPEVVKIVEVEKPQPKENEVLVKIKATTVTSGDDRLRGGKFPPLVSLPFKLMMGFSKLKNDILGISFAGIIEDAGNKVTKFKRGDKVYGSTDFDMGCHAEYKCVKESGLIDHIPEAVSFEDAGTLLFGYITALYFLRKGNIKKGDKILIHGASGSLGTAAIQLAKLKEAEVTAVCSTKNLELVKSLGADHIIDYTKEDFTTNINSYDLVFDTLGKCPFNKTLNALKPEGYFLRAVHIDLISLIRGFLTSITSKKKVLGGMAKENLEDMKYLMSLLEDGKIKVVKGNIFTLDDIQEAHKVVDSGHKVGNVVIKIGDE